MKKVINTIAVLILISFVFSSCGVMFGGSKFSGTITAKDHPDADIYVNGIKQGKGSSVGSYPRNEPLAIELRQEGCDNKIVTYNKTFRGGNFVLSLITWGVIGIGVDLGTGASYKPDHKLYSDVDKVSDKIFSFNVDYSECDPTISASSK